MRELVWYSVTGFVLLAGCIVFHPGAFAGAGILLVALGAGFILHQAGRSAFESEGGFARADRPVIRHIREKLGPKYNAHHMTREDGFLVWETAFYSDGFPAAFREHDHRAWQVVTGLRGMQMAARLGFTVYTVYAVLPFALAAFMGRSPIRFTAPWTGGRDGSTLMWGAVFLMLAVYLAVNRVFGQKAELTKASIERQEMAVLTLYHDLFAATIKKVAAGKG